MLLEALEHNGPVNVDPVGGQRQRVGYPAPGTGEHGAEGPHLAGRRLGGFQSRRARLVSDTCVARRIPKAACPASSLLLGTDPAHNKEAAPVILLDMAQALGQKTSLR